jgi:hypothetical protein
MKNYSFELCSHLSALPEWIETNFAMKMATYIIPIIDSITQTARVTGIAGVTSPKPTVARVMKLKYITSPD